MKKEYMNPNAQLVLFEAEDVVLASGGGQEDNKWPFNISRNGKDLFSAGNNNDNFMQ